MNPSSSASPDAVPPHPAAPAPRLDPLAIARHVQQQLTAQQVTVAARWQQQQLQVVLQSPQEIDPDRALAALYHTLQEQDHPAEAIAGVQVVARTAPSKTVQWRRDLSMAVLSFYDLDPVELTRSDPHPIAPPAPPSSSPSVSPGEPQIPSRGPRSAALNGPSPGGRPSPHPSDSSTGTGRSPAVNPWVAAVRHCTPEHWQILAVSLVSGALLAFIGWPGALLQPLVIIVHELGHTVAYWLFGYVAIPAFDFIYGGGVTVAFGGRSLLLLTGIYGGLAYLFYRYWNNVLTARVLLGLTIVYLWLAYTDGHQAIVALMGHGFELIFGVLFLYRALSGFGCKRSGERSLNGTLGAYIWAHDIEFCWRLLSDRAYMLEYFQGKGGIDHDFVRLAADYWGIQFQLVITGFLLLTLLVPVGAWLGFRYDVGLASTLHRLFWIRNDGHLRHR